MEHLLPVGQVPTLEYIFELQERLCVVQIDLFCSADEVIDRFIESKLDSKLARILMNFSLLFVTRIIALLLVDITQRCHFRPGFLALKVWHSLIKRGHSNTLYVTMIIELVNFCFLSAGKAVITARYHTREAIIM
jgi:hypothetical protein